MSREDNPLYGALIERGIILSEESAAYTVKSLDRDGVVTPPITAINGGYDPGECVFFFLFRDGTGKIIGSVED